MMTVLWAIFYLWLVLSVLLGAMWILHKQDQRRNEPPDDDVLLPAVEEPLSQAAKLADAEATAAPSKPEPESKSKSKSKTQAEAKSRSQSKPRAKSQSKPPAKSPAESPGRSKPGAQPQSKPQSQSKTKSKRRPQARSKAQAEAKTNSSTKNSSTNGNGGSPSNGANSTGTGTDNNSDSGSSTHTGTGTGTGTGVSSEEPTIEQLLDGITLPYGLARAEECIVDSGRHAVYLSTHPDAEEVGTAFADQLVDLGYDIEPAGFDQALAVRDGQVLSMRIAANAGAQDNGNSGRYPHADESDVAIEVWTGDGPAPSIRN